MNTTLHCLAQCAQQYRPSRVDRRKYKTKNDIAEFIVFFYNTGKLKEKSRVLKGLVTQRFSPFLYKKVLCSFSYHIASQNQWSTLSSVGTKRVLFDVVKNMPARHTRHQEEHGKRPVTSSPMHLLFLHWSSASWQNKSQVNFASMLTKAFRPPKQVQQFPGNKIVTELLEIIYGSIFERGPIGAEENLPLKLVGLVWGDPLALLQHFC